MRDFKGMTVGSFVAVHGTKVQSWLRRNLFEAIFFIFKHCRGKIWIANLEPNSKYLTQFYHDLGALILLA